MRIRHLSTMAFAAVFFAALSGVEKAAPQGASRALRPGPSRRASHRTSGDGRTGYGIFERCCGGHRQQEPAIRAESIAAASGAARRSRNQTQNLLGKQLTRPKPLFMHLS
jgi:hypothetical protein